MTITCWVGCSDNQQKEASNECPYMDSTSNSEMRTAAFTRNGNIDQDGKLVSIASPHEKYFGIDMSHGGRQGDGIHTDVNGNKYSFATFTTVITNDTTLPIKIKLNLPTEYTYPSPYNKQKFKLFLLPKKETLQEQIDHNHISEESKNLLTLLSTSVTLNNGFLMVSLSEETKKFIKNYVPSTLDQTVNPNEKYTITIGMLVDTKYIPPGQLALITKGHKYPFFLTTAI